MFKWVGNLFSRNIIRKNVAMMTGSGKEQMLGLLGDESMGSNAGSYRGRPCYIANFEFDNATGEIRRFTNIPEKKTYKRGGFKLRIAENWSHEIIETRLPSDASQRAEEIIALSVKLYEQVEKKEKKI